MEAFRYPSSLDPIDLYLLRSALGISCSLSLLLLLACLFSPHLVANFSAANDYSANIQCNTWWELLCLCTAFTTSKQNILGQD